MTTHVPDEALVDLALGAGSAEDRAHASACGACGPRVAELRETLELARQAEVPEPSPLYWDAMRNGVSRRIAEERRLPRFVILVPLAAAAALVAVLWMGPRAAPPRESPPPPLAAWSALPPVEQDDGLRVLEGLASANGGLAEWSEAGGLGSYLANLTEEESRVVADTLRQQRRGGES